MANHFIMANEWLMELFFIIQKQVENGVDEISSGKQVCRPTLSHLAAPYNFISIRFPLSFSFYSPFFLVCQCNVTSSTLTWYWFICEKIKCHVIKSKWGIQDQRISNVKACCSTITPGNTFGVRFCYSLVTVVSREPISVMPPELWNYCTLMCLMFNLISWPKFE